jgi:hypothetical protein
MAEFPLAGVPVDKYGDAKTDKGRRSLLAMEEEEDGPSPLAMGLLQLGASMMRDEGWRDRPITLGESLGKAIPHGITGYYNQDMLNRQEEQGRSAERRTQEAQRQAEKQALFAAEEKAAADAQQEKNTLAFKEQVLEAPGLSDASRNNILAMYALKPIKGIEMFNEKMRAYEEKMSTASKRDFTKEAKKLSDILWEILPEHEQGNLSIVMQLDDPEERYAAVKEIWERNQLVAPENVTEETTITGAELAQIDPAYANADPNMIFPIKTDVAGNITEVGQPYPFTAEEEEVAEVQFVPGTIMTGAALNKEAGEEHYQPGRRYIEKQEGIFEPLRPNLFKNESSLRTSYEGVAALYRKARNSYSAVVSGYENSIAAAKRGEATGFSDIELIRGFLLMLEPGSIVRESEYLSVAQAQSIKEQMRNFDKKIAEGAVLSQKSREAIMNAARSYMSRAKQSFQPQIDQYRKIAKDNNFRVDHVVLDPFAGLQGLQKLKPIVYEDLYLFDTEPKVQRISEVGKEKGKPKFKRGG